MDDKSENVFSIHTQKLSYMIFDPRSVPSEYKESYRRLYQFWHKSWLTTFNELDKIQNLSSDDFLRQHAVSGIFYEEKVVGCFLYGQFDLTDESNLNHSYFATYPEAVLAELRSRGCQTAMTMGYLAVDREWRKASVGSLISEAFIGLAVKSFEQSSADALIAYTRNDRKVNELVARHGARTLARDLSAHNVKVDFISIYRDSIQKTPVAGVVNVIERLWRDRIDACGVEHSFRRKSFGLAKVG